MNPTVTSIPGHIEIVWIETILSSSASDPVNTLCLPCGTGFFFWQISTKDWSGKTWQNVPVWQFFPRMKGKEREKEKSTDMNVNRKWTRDGTRAATMRWWWWSGPQPIPAGQGFRHVEPSAGAFKHFVHEAQRNNVFAPCLFGLQKMPKQIKGLRGATHTSLLRKRQCWWSHKTKMQLDMPAIDHDVFL